MIKNIIFDWSGVLADDFEHSYHCIRKIIEKRGQTLSKKEYREEYVLPYSLFYERRKINATPKELMDEYREHVSKLTSPIKAINGAKIILQELSELKINLAVLSSSSQALKNATHLGFMDYFTYFYEDKHDKDQALTKLLKESNFAPEETALIGDTEYDVLTAKKHGLFSIAFTEGYRPKKELQKVEPDAIINSLNQIIPLIK